MKRHRQSRNKLAQISELVSLLFFLSLSHPALGASADGPAYSAAWNTVIVLIAFAATVGSAVLNFAAIRQWDRNWGLVSGLPLLGLLIWCGVILLGKSIDGSSHALWQLEIFAWAMINMIYMVTAMTAKRMFAKKDAENSSGA